MYYAPKNNLVQNPFLAVFKDSHLGHTIQTNVIKT